MNIFIWIVLGVILLGGAATLVIVGSRFARQARFGANVGQSNPRFFDAKAFNDLVLASYGEAKFEPHTGPFLFEFQRHGMSTDEFCSRLD